MNKQPQDWQARLDAVDPARSFLVQAPAGSGKTELLTDRILALLPTVTRPEEIVAITFTRKAAAEMHARVMQKLAAGRGPAPDAEHLHRSWQLARKALEHDAKQGWHLLEHPGRLTIQTIDSFCASLVRRMPYLSQLGGMPSTVDDARPHYLAAARATLALAEEEALGAPIRTLLAHLDVDLRATEALIADMLASRDQWLPLLGGFSIVADDAERVALEGNLHAVVSEELQALANAMPMGWQFELPPIARAVASCQPEDSQAAVLAGWEGDLPATPDALPYWQALAALLLTGKGELRKPGGLNVKNGFPKDTAHKVQMAEWLDGQGVNPQAEWIIRLASVNTLPEPVFANSQWTALSSLLTTLKLAAAQLIVHFAQTGEVDFTEIAQRALNALGQSDAPSDLLLKLDASIRHLLIDEFQDTSQPQIDLLARLTAGWQTDDMGRGDGRTLFLVGDPMQSIYRFRKAEVGLFLAARDHGVGEISPAFLALTDNFRSQAGIVDWVNTSFAKLFPPHDDAESSAIAYAKSSAFNAQLEGPAVTFHPVWKRDGLALAQPEDATVLQLVQNALAANPEGSVAILVRAKSHAHAIARSLTGAGIAHKAVELTPLAQRPVVADLVQLARALSHGGDRLAWLCVLRAPWCGLTLNTLATLFSRDFETTIPALLRHSPNVAALPDDERQRVEAASAILLDDSNASGALPFAAWVASIWRKLGGPNLYATARDAMDAERFFQLLEELAPYGGLDPATLDDALARLFAAADPAAGRVEIMTMHKSKGLQFDTVILPGLQRKSPPDHPPLLRLELSQGRLLLGPIKPLAETEHDPVSRYLGERNKRRAEYEIDRLLYVAATRAKHRLHLVGELNLNSETGEIRKPQASSLMARLWPVLVIPAPPVAEVATAAPESAGEWLGPLLTRVASMPGAESAPTSQPVASPRFGLGHAKVESAVGTLAHAWLERIGQDGLARWPAAALTAALPQMQTQLTRSGVPAVTASAAARTVLDALLATLEDERGRWLLTQPARREWRLHDMAGRQSIIDLALETAEGWLIVDYKTTRRQVEETAEAFAARLVAAYRPQLRRYAIQLQQLTGRPAVGALYLPLASLWLDVPVDDGLMAEVVDGAADGVPRA
ncbi:UvrD-helicase domain-containing protein [Andreprevotia chitinilytica]|uniref:UvrD-helicase domain-containing protein n=1 Tax=Andreprevotia chitinilytica TaxID=396808 RepID=UPI0009FE5A97|nr:UvrD-helicase domain-containing protein [Andreprevotia chitinilytica]